MLDHADGQSLAGPCFKRLDRWFYSYQEQLTSQIVSQKGKQTKPLQKWEELNATKLEHIRHLISKLIALVMDVSMLTLARRLFVSS